MPGLRIDIDVNAAKRASAQLRSELKTLGSSALTSEKDFKKLEDRLEKGMKADKAKKTLDALNNSIKLSRLEMARHQARIGDYGGAFETLSSGAGTSAKRIALLGVAISSLAVGGATLLGSKFLDTAVKFEKFNIQLKTLTGSSQKADAAMKWITNFTAKTPYELDEVTQSFVKLNAYGLDSETWMKTLGDTAAAMGKSLDQAVEMFADAAVGEFERLKEFGVKASTEGDTVTFKWSQNGQDMVKTAQKTQSGITSALGQIFSRFDGSMDDLSDSWGGMTSNISDIWTQFQNKVMTSGPFEEMKSSLKSFLGYLNSHKGQMDLAGWAEDISIAVLDVVHKFQDWIDKNKEFLRQDLPGEIKEIAGQIIIVGGTISGVLSSALSGYNSLPLIAKEIGLLGAMAFGPKGFAILVAGSVLIDDYMNRFNALKKTLNSQASSDHESGSVTKPISGAYTPGSHNSLTVPKQQRLNLDLTSESKEAKEKAAKIASEIESAYQSAYSSLDTITQKTFDHMMSKYRQDRDEFIKLTGDKETAMAVYSKNVTDLTEKMHGNMNGTGRLIADWIEASNKQYAEWIVEQKDKIKDFNEAHKKATMTTTEYELYQLKQRYDNYSQFIDDKDKLDEFYQAEQKKITEETNRTWSDAFSGWASSYSSTLNDMLWGSETTFEGIATSFGKMITEMIIQQELIEPFVSSMRGSDGWINQGIGAIAGMFTASAHGNVFGANPAGISAYSNKIVSSPTVFPFASGIGLMGEAGAEAILPLTRTSSGNLGVEAKGSIGAASVQINIENNTKSNVTASQDQPKWDGEKWVIGLVLKAVENNTGNFRTTMKAKLGA